MQKELDHDGIELLDYGFPTTNMDYLKKLKNLLLIYILKFMQYLVQVDLEKKIKKN